ncbi:MAG: TetR/AcrR family transcriptional regulator [Bdellovibrio sp.]
MDTKSRALALGQSYLQTLGYNGFSFQTIADRLHIKKASLHYYFASKEELGLALISSYQQDFETWAEGLKSSSGPKKLNSFIEIFLEFSQDKNKICPQGVLCSDFNTLPPSLQKKLLSFHENQKAWLQKMLQDGIRNGEFRRDLPISATADFILSSLQGGVQMARLRKDFSIIKKIGHCLHDFLKIPPPS